MPYRLNVMHNYFSHQCRIIPALLYIIWTIHQQSCRPCCRYHHQNSQDHQPGPTHQQTVVTPTGENQSQWRQKASESPGRRQ